MKRGKITTGTGLEVAPRPLIPEIENLDAWLDGPDGEFSQHGRAWTWMFGPVWLALIAAELVLGRMVIYRVWP